MQYASICVFVYYRVPSVLCMLVAGLGFEDRSVSALETTYLYDSDPVLRANCFYRYPSQNSILSLVIPSSVSTEMPVPRHDPTQTGALVMKRPDSVPNGKRVVDVVVGPILAKHLRPHQREGVQFLYECVMGMRSFNGEGAILADDMGLGKTLQTITLLWTLLKQNPVYGDSPVVKKALIVCPVSLVKVCFHGLL